MTVLVAGAGGFIGGHLVRYLENHGERVRAVDIKPLKDWLYLSQFSENWQSDLSIEANCMSAIRGVRKVYQLAADMGGMGFISNEPLACMLSSLITTRLLMASAYEGVEKFFYSSSVCVYPEQLLDSDFVEVVKEHQAYPASPAEDYGWEKLFSERMCRAFLTDEGLETRVARFDTIYGPYCTWKGGREKAPAALIRKVLEAKLSGNHEIEIWGDGEQTRTFLYVDDCVRAVEMLVNDDETGPINIGSSELITINQYVDMIERLAKIRCRRIYNHHEPQGARNRKVDCSYLEDQGWEQMVSLESGIEQTYAWISGQMAI